MSLISIQYKHQLYSYLSWVTYQKIWPKNLKNSWISITFFLVNWQLYLRKHKLLWGNCFWYLWGILLGVLKRPVYFWFHSIGSLEQIFLSLRWPGFQLQDRYLLYFLKDSKKQIGTLTNLHIYVEWVLKKIGTSYLLYIISSKYNSHPRNSSKLTSYSVAKQSRKKIW